MGCEIIPFNQLKTSTRTIVVHTNLIFNLIYVFAGLYVTAVDTPLTSKKKKVDRKRLSGPYGAVIGVQKGNLYRGINLRTNETHWCTSNCRRKGTTKTGKVVEINTVVERSELIEGTDIYRIRYYCTECETYYTLRQLGRNTSFQNQTTIVLSLGDIVINVMLFKDNFKMAGCKTDDNATDAIRILWEDQIQGLNAHYGFDVWSLKKDGDLKKYSTPRFLFRPVMRNMNFKLAFFVDRNQLNLLMNKSKYSDTVAMSRCDTTGNANVNIKMHTAKPDDHYYDCLVYPSADGSGKVQLIPVKDNDLKTKKDRKPVRITFVVFSSAEVILSGRYPSMMKDRYEFFIKEMQKHRKQLEEKIVSTKLSVSDFLIK